MVILDYLVSGWHGFGSVTQVCFGIAVSNFMYMSFVAVGRRLTIVSYVAFKMAALWFWTMFNCNPPIAHCHPFIWGGGILVDHWSTISTFDILVWDYDNSSALPMELLNLVLSHVYLYYFQIIIPIKPQTQIQNCLFKIFSYNVVYHMISVADEQHIYIK